jgi:hypothetical protein
MNHVPVPKFLVLTVTESHNTMVQTCLGASTLVNLQSKFVLNIRAPIFCMLRLRYQASGTLIQSIVLARGSWCALFENGKKVERSRRLCFHQCSSLTGQNPILKNPEGIGMNRVAERSLRQAGNPLRG